MCVRNPKGNVGATDAGWYFEEATIAATAQLTRELMEKYNIPEANVVRHYDVTGKICPAPFVNSSAAWDKFKARLREEEEQLTQEQFNKMMDVYLTDLTSKPVGEWSKDARIWAEDKGVIKGDAKGNKNYCKFLTREEAAQILYNLHKEGE